MSKLSSDSNNFTNQFQILKALSANPALKEGMTTDVISNIAHKLRARKLDMRSSMSYHMKSLFQCMLYLNTCASKNPTFSDLIEPQMVSLCNYIPNNINDLLPRHATSIKTLSYCCEVTPLLQKYIGEDSLKVEAHIIRILADKRVS